MACAFNFSLQFRLPLFLVVSLFENKHLFCVVPLILFDACSILPNEVWKEQCEDITVNPEQSICGTVINASISSFLYPEISVNAAIL
jgi:hypothetical protein